MFTRLRRRDEGETLLEVLVALVILGVAAVAIVGAMTVSVKVSDTHRKQATASTYVRDYAESIEQAVTGGGYADGTRAYPAYSPGSGYTAAMTAKKCWTSTGWADCTTTNDNGVQRLTLQVASTDGRATEQLVIVVRKPCAPGGALC